MSQKKAVILSVLELESFKGVALSGGLHANLPQKDIERKNKFNWAKSGCKKKFNRANLTLILWAKCMPIAFELQQGLFFVFTNCQT
jgi:hypothetical protein